MRSFLRYESASCLFRPYLDFDQPMPCWMEEVNLFGLAGNRTWFPFDMFRYKGFLDRSPPRRDELHAGSSGTRVDLDRPHGPPLTFSGGEKNDLQSSKLPWPTTTLEESREDVVADLYIRKFGLVDTKVHDGVTPGAPSEVSDVELVSRYLPRHLLPFLGRGDEVEENSGSEGGGSEGGTEFSLGGVGTSAGSREFSWANGMLSEGLSPRHVSGDSILAAGDVEMGDVMVEPEQDIDSENMRRSSSSARQERTRGKTEERPHDDNKNSSIRLVRPEWFRSSMDASADERKTPPAFREFCVNNTKTSADHADADHDVPPPKQVNVSLVAGECRYPIFSSPRATTGRGTNPRAFVDQRVVAEAVLSEDYVRRCAAAEAAIEKLSERAMGHAVFDFVQEKIGLAENDKNVAHLTELDESTSAARRLQLRSSEQQEAGGPPPINGPRGPPSSKPEKNPSAVQTFEVDRFGRRPPKKISSPAASSSASSNFVDDLASHRKDLDTKTLKRLNSEEERKYNSIWEKYLKLERVSKLEFELLKTGFLFWMDLLVIFRGIILDELAGELNRTEEVTESHEPGQHHDFLTSTSLDEANNCFSRSCFVVNAEQSTSSAGEKTFPHFYQRTSFDGALWGFAQDAHAHDHALLENIRQTWTEDILRSDVGVAAWLKTTTMHDSLRNGLIAELGKFEVGRLGGGATKPGCGEEFVAGEEEVYDTTARVQAGAVSSSSVRSSEKHLLTAGDVLDPAYFSAAGRASKVGPAQQNNSSTSQAHPIFWIRGAASASPGGGRKNVTFVAPHEHEIQNVIVPPDVLTPEGGLISASSRSSQRQRTSTGPKRQKLRHRMSLPSLISAARRTSGRLAYVANFVQNDQLIERRRRLQMLDFDMVTGPFDASESLARPEGAVLPVSDLVGFWAETKQVDHSVGPSIGGAGGSRRGVSSVGERLLPAPAGDGVTAQPQSSAANREQEPLEDDMEQEDSEDFTPDHNLQREFALFPIFDRYDEVFSHPKSFLMAQDGFSRLEPWENLHGRDFAATPCLPFFGPPPVPSPNTPSDNESAKSPTVGADGLWGNWLCGARNFVKKHRHLEEEIYPLSLGPVIYKTHFGLKSPLPAASIDLLTNGRRLLLNHKIAYPKAHSPTPWRRRKASEETPKMLVMERLSRMFSSGGKSNLEALDHHVRWDDWDRSDSGRAAASLQELQHVGAGTGWLILYRTGFRPVSDQFQTGFRLVSDRIQTSAACRICGVHVTVSQMSTFAESMSQSSCHVRCTV